MTEPVVRLEPARVSVAPGGQVTVQVTVHNPGTVVEGYDVEVVSQTPMPWATAVPPTLSVYPQQEATTVVTFAPPTGHGTPSGSFPFGVLLRSQVDPERSAVAEGDIDIGSVSGLQASLTPVTSKGRWRGSHSLKVENWGNSAARLKIVASDPDEALGFLVSPPLLELPLGGQGYARVKVRTRHPVLRGSTQRLPFKVVCEPDGDRAPPGPLDAVSTPERPVLDGGFTQKPILDRWVVIGAALMLAALVALAVWLFQQRGEEEADDVEEVVLDAPSGVQAAPGEPATVLLSWDAATGVDGYKVIQTRPALTEQAVTALYDPEDPSRYLVRLQVTTEDIYCYQLQATRESGAESASSEEACTPQPITLPVEATPSPSAGPISPAAPAGNETPVPPGGVPQDEGTATETSPTTSTTTPPAPSDPQQWISVLRFYTGTPETVPAGADSARTALTDAGFAAKLLHSSLWSMEPPLAEEGWLLYVDAATPEELVGDCDAILDAAPDAVPGLDCGLDLPRQVLARPSGSPTPTS